MPTYEPKFVVRPAVVGTTWSVWMVGGYEPPEEVNDFPTLRRANDWIDSESGDWLVRREAAKAGI